MVDDWDDLWTAAPAPGQLALLGDDKQFHPRWQEWRGMPEYVMEAQEPFASVVVRFANPEDRQAFFEAIKQPNLIYADGIWFPPPDSARYWDLRYRDASNDDSEVVIVTDPDATLRQGMFFRHRNPETGRVGLWHRAVNRYSDPPRQICLCSAEVGSNPFRAGQTVIEATGAFPVATEACSDLRTRGWVRQ